MGINCAPMALQACRTGVLHDLRHETQPTNSLQTRPHVTNPNIFGSATMRWARNIRMFFFFLSARASSVLGPARLCWPMVFCPLSLSGCPLVAASPSSNMEKPKEKIQKGEPRKRGWHPCEGHLARAHGPDTLRGLGFAGSGRPAGSSRARALRQACRFFGLISCVPGVVCLMPVNINTFF